MITWGEIKEIVNNERIFADDGFYNLNTQGVQQAFRVNQDIAKNNFRFQLKTLELPLNSNLKWSLLNLLPKEGYKFDDMSNLSSVSLSATERYGIRYTQPYNHNYEPQISFFLKTTGVSGYPSLRISVFELSGSNLASTTPYYFKDFNYSSLPTVAQWVTFDMNDVALPLEYGKSYATVLELKYSDDNPDYSSVGLRLYYNNAGGTTNFFPFSQTRACSLGGEYGGSGLISCEDYSTTTTLMAGGTQFLHKKYINHTGNLPFKVMNMFFYYPGTNQKEYLNPERIWADNNDFQLYLHTFALGYQNMNVELVTRNLVVDAITGNLKPNFENDNDGWLVPDEYIDVMVNGILRGIAKKQQQNQTDTDVYSVANADYKKAFQSMYDLESIVYTEQEPMNTGFQHSSITVK